MVGTHGATVGGNSGTVGAYHASVGANGAAVGANSGTVGANGMTVGGKNTPKSAKNAEKPLPTGVNGQKETVGGGISQNDKSPRANRIGWVTIAQPFMAGLTTRGWGKVPSGTAERFFRPIRDWTNLPDAKPSHQWLGYFQSRRATGSMLHPFLRHWLAEAFRRDPVAESL